MASDRKSIQALRNLIAEADLILETTPPLPENRTGAAREVLRTGTHHTVAERKRNV